MKPSPAAEETAYKDSFIEKFACNTPISDRNRLAKEKKELTSRLVSANDLIFQLQKGEDGKAKKIVEQTQQIKSLEQTVDTVSTQLTDARSAVEGMKTALATYVDIPRPVPEFLDESKKVYVPRIQAITPDGKIDSFEVSDPRDMFSTCELVRKIVLDKKWRALSRFTKLLSVWRYIADPNVRTYLADFGDNWQLALLTLIRKLGDCEDSAVLFLVICRMLGLFSDEIFLAVGPTGFGYHAYPIVKLNKEDIIEMNYVGYVEGWYIFESTLNGIPVRPRPLKGSNYWIDNGLMNWEHVGSIRSEFLDEFNGVRPGVAPGASDEAIMSNLHRKVLNSRDKIALIQKDWENEGQVKRKK